MKVCVNLIGEGEVFLCHGDFKKVRDGKTYFVVNDYPALRELFGKLLAEIQRVKSEGD